MKYKQTDITLLAAPFGFGPLGKALAIAHEFKKQGLTVKVLSDKSAIKIIKASNLPYGTYEYRQPLNLATLNTKIVLSCLDISTPIIKSGIPLVFIDSLFWLRGVWEKIPTYNADLFIAQRFFIDAPEYTRQLVESRLHLVDAILPRPSIDSTVNNDGELIVLYPGGMRSPYLSLDYQEKYLSWAIDLVTETISYTKVDPSNFVAIIPPQLLSSNVTNKVIDSGGSVESSLGNLEYFLHNARCLITAPGIEITLEACAAGKTPYYLPAFNGSHVPQLRAYRQAAVGCELCPTHTSNLIDSKAKDINLSRLSMEVEKQNIDTLLHSSYKKEGIANLLIALEQNDAVKNRYPLGKYGALQTVDLSLSLL